MILLAKEENKKNIIEREKKAVQRILYVFCRHWIEERKTKRAKKAENNKSKWNQLVKNIFLIKPQASACYSNIFSSTLSHMILINQTANRKRIVCIAFTILNNVEIKVFADRIFYFDFQAVFWFKSTHLNKEQIGCKIGRQFHQISDMSLCWESTHVKITAFLLYKFHKSCKNIFSIQKTVANRKPKSMFVSSIFFILCFWFFLIHITFSSNIFQFSSISLTFTTLKLKTT